jgi:hypothetical protein
MRSLQMINACTNARRWLPAAAWALLLAGLSACGGGGAMTTSTSPPAATASGCSASTCGSAVMTITDAAGDFLSYKVNLVSLQLQKADGTLVETLPATTAVDFVQLITLSEVISTRRIPPGNYVAAQVTVDFTNASIMVDDGTGTGVAVTPVDSTGTALGQLALTVQLDNSNNLKISGAKASRIGFDFNLLASNSVNLTTKTVTVSPVLEASVVPVDNKQVRVRGEISAVSTADDNYTVSVDPFNDHDANDGNNNNSGSGNDANDKVLPLVVNTTAATTFEINGTPFSGAAGLAQLATLPLTTISVAFGSLSTTDQSFTATTVLAGTSVSGGNLDHIQGSVVARVGNTLTIHGARMDDRDGHDDNHFVAGNATVTIAAATAVTEQGQTSATPAHTIAEISVGSLIDAFGTASTDSSGKVTLDATAARVRLDLTHVQGALAVSATGKLTLSLTSIDRQPLTLFSFTGTGSASGVDTDPTKYVVTTGALNLTPFSVGGSVLGIGFVNPFGTTPPDFTAVTLANGIMGDDSDGNDANDNGNNNNNSGKGAQMDIDWGNSGTTTPFKVLTATDLDLDVTNSSIGSKHRIQVDPQDVDIEQLSSDVMIVGATSGMTLFAITGQHGRMTDNFQSFADFETALAADLNGTTTALRLTAQGQYDASTNTFTAQRISILLSN